MKTAFQFCQFVQLRSLICSTLFASFVVMPGVANAQLVDSIFTVAKPPASNVFKLEQFGGLSVRGAYDGGSLSVAPADEGAGSRLMWMPSRGAFRAGYVTGTQWDNANIGYFSVAIGNSTRASAANAVAMGFESVAAQTSAVAIGENNTASGAASVALGYHAHTNARQGSFVFGDRSTVDTIRAGVNHSANWRVSGGFRIFTSSNLTTGMTFQSGASVSNWGQSSAVISTSTGAYLSTGGVWQNASDVNRKHGFADVSGEALLAKLKALDITSWSYKTEPANVRHIGPTAQDFYAQFGLGNSNVSIGTVDADGVALACIQALEKRTSEQSAQLALLKQQNDLLSAKLLLAQSPAQQPVLSYLPWLLLLGVGGWLLHLSKTRKSKAPESV